MTTSRTDSRPAPTGESRWERFRVLLESQRADCLRQRQLALADTVASVPDDVAVARAASLQHTVQEIDAALGRIAAGTYGRCLRCGTELPEERLELRPFATCCVRCQSVR